MNVEIVKSIVRQLLLAVGGALVSKGVLEDGMMQEIVGALITLGASIWALSTRTKAGLASSAAQSAPKETAAQLVIDAPRAVLSELAKTSAVTKIVTDSYKLARSIPSSKVVGPSG